MSNAKNSGLEVRGTGTLYVLVRTPWSAARIGSQIRRKSSTAQTAACLRMRPLPPGYHMPKPLSPSRKRPPAKEAPCEQGNAMIKATLLVDNARAHNGHARTRQIFVHHAFAQDRGINSTSAHDQRRQSQVQGGQKQAAAVTCAVPVERGRDALCPTAALLHQPRRPPTAPMAHVALGLPQATLPCR